jgi:hypothetical protein
LTQFRAIIESDSPSRAAERLKAAGCTLLGPWAAEVGSTAKALSLAEELDVTVLVDAGDSADAAEQVHEIVGTEAHLQILRVVPVEADGTTCRRTRGGSTGEVGVPEESAADRGG